MHRKIVRTNIRRGDVTVDLLSLSPAAKLAVAEALEEVLNRHLDDLDMLPRGWDTGGIGVGGKWDYS